MTLFTQLLISLFLLLQSMKASGSFTTTSSSSETLEEAHSFDDDLSDEPEDALTSLSDLKNSFGYYCALGDYEGILGLLNNKMLVDSFTVTDRAHFFTTAVHTALDQHARFMMFCQESLKKGLPKPEFNADGMKLARYLASIPNFLHVKSSQGSQLFLRCCKEGLLPLVVPLSRCQGISFPDVFSAGLALAASSENWNIVRLLIQEFMYRLQFEQFSAHAFVPSQVAIALHAAMQYDQRHHGMAEAKNILDFHGYFMSNTSLLHALNSYLMLCMEFNEAAMVVNFIGSQGSRFVPCINNATDLGLHYVVEVLSTLEGIRRSREDPQGLFLPTDLWTHVYAERMNDLIKSIITRNAEAGSQRPNDYSPRH